jgi:hypothetical protein
MIATQSEHDLRPDPHFLIKCPPIYELISNDSISLISGRRRIAALEVEITRNYSTGQVK